jgi:hypothetical protein
MIAYNTAVKPGSVYEHYKGNRYKIIGVSRCSETLEWFVVYECLYENEASSVWHRPLDMFLETIVVNDRSVQRFTLIE